MLHWSELPAFAAASAVTVADVEAAANAAKPNECCAYIYTRCEEAQLPACPLASGALTCEVLGCVYKL